MGKLFTKIRRFIMPETDEKSTFDFLNGVDPDAEAESEEVVPEAVKAGVDITPELIARIKKDAEKGIDLTKAPAKYGIPVFNIEQIISG